MMLENIGLAFSSIKSNKMRALLTMLGIIIGIMSIIAIMMIGDALTETVTGNFADMGANNVTVGVQQRGEQTSSMMAMFGMSTSTQSKSPDNDDMISDQMIEEMQVYFGEDIAGVSLSHSAGSAQAKDGDLYANVSVTGVSEGYTVANSITMLKGDFITEADVQAKGQVAVVSDKFVNNMFPNGENPIGQEVKVYKPTSIEIYTVVGVYEYTSMGFGGSASEKDLSTSMYIPVSTAKQDLIDKNFNSITVVVPAGGDVELMTTRLQNYFDKVYRENKEWKISVSNMTSILDTVSSTMSTISIAIAFIAGISLLVGGIGVMNIMLVSVTERTREIGTRKALGAKNHHIQIQFVIEAMIIALIGGVIGLLLGIALGSVACTIFGVAVTISPTVTIGSVLFSMAIGVFFGLYPANKAAKLDPIEALRYE